MCGICGIYNYSTDEPPDGRLLHQMREAMHHRGPDDAGVHVDGGLGLAMRRLSIIDLEGGAQPITNEVGTVWVVSNGEIYNFQELRRELESYGHDFKTRSDTEVVVHAYEQWGIEALRKLNGMFGLAIWDSVRRKLVLARDPFGVKPLYFWEDARTLAFASEIRSLLRHPRIERAVDVDALPLFLAYAFVPSPWTAFAGINKLPPGHALICTSVGSRIQRFYEFASDPPDGQKESDLVDQLRETIQAAVKRQMVADVPVGAMLSGGVDSTTVAAIMGECAENTIDTFTVGFGGSFARDELQKARSIARHLGTRHHEVVVSVEEFADFLPKSIDSLEEPIATSSTLAFYKVCELAREHVKVVLTGQGADEPFGGYARYFGERYGSLYRLIPALLREEILSPLIRRLPRNEQLKRAVTSLRSHDPLERMERIYSIIDGPLLRELVRGANASGDGDRRVLERWLPGTDLLDSLARMMYVDARLSLPDNLLLYGDKMSMAVSLEARVPFLDLELMSLAESIPSRLKIKGLTRKYIFKRAVAHWVPDEVMTLRKVGFTTPVDQWFRGELRGMVEDRLLGTGSACRQYLQPKVIRVLLDEHASGRHDYKRILFALLTFELWHEQFIASPRALAA